MKLYLLIVLTILISSLNATQFVAIIPYGFDCGKEPSGQGYYLPLQKCININFQDTYFEIVDDQLIVTFGTNCTDPDPIKLEYDLDKCQIFKLLNTRTNYASIISTVAAPPKNAISNNFYFNSNSCTGDYFQIFHTNGSTEDFYKYSCNNGIPSIYNCYPSNSDCTPINTNGCNSPSKYVKYPTDVTCQK